MRSRWFNIITLLGLLLGMVSPVTVQAAPPANTPSAPSRQDEPLIEVESEPVSYTHLTLPTTPYV